MKDSGGECRKSVEAEGKTVSAAIQSALRQLGITPDQAEIKILTEGRRGLFGMKGAKLAKVKVTVRDVPEKSSGNRE